jgi:MFS family permease
MFANSQHEPLSIRQLILPLYLPTFILSISQSSMMPILPIFADNFQAGYGWVGVVLAGQGLGTLIGDVPAGMILRKLGVRTTMYIGVFIWGISALGLVWAHHIAIVLILQILGGIGFGFFGTARMLFISDKLPLAIRGQAVSLVGGVFRIGKVIGPAAAGWLAVRYDIRAGFVFFFVVTMLGLLSLFLFMPQFYPSEKKEDRSSIGTVLKDNARVYSTGGTGQFVLALLRSGPRVIIPLYGANVLGLGVDSIGNILSLAAVLDVFLFLPAGWIMDNMGRKFSAVPSIAFLGLSLFLIPFTKGYNGLLIMALLGGFGNGISSGIIMTLGADFAPLVMRGEFLGIWRLIGDAGNTSSSLIIGALADLLTLQQTIIALSSFSIVGILLFAFGMPEPLERPMWKRKKYHN